MESLWTTDKCSTKLKTFYHDAWTAQRTKNDCQKSFSLYKLKPKLAFETFLDNHEASNVFLKAKIGALPGKPCPVCSDADRTLSHFLHHCHMLPSKVTISTALSRSLQNLTSDEEKPAPLLGFSRITQAKSECVTFLRLAKKRWLAREAVVQVMRKELQSMLE